MIKAVVAFRKAVAGVTFKNAIASIKLGNFLIFRFFFETLGLSDVHAKVFGKSLSDSQNVTDSENKVVAKIISESSATNDSVSLSVNASHSDSSATLDSIDTLAFSKTLQDSSSASQNQTMAFHKFIDEPAGVTDDLDGEATADDDQEMIFTKVRSDLATMIDILAYGSGKGLSDTLGSSDLGSIRSQGYCAFDYFLDDYVGASRTF
jgi:hypothetical protein